MRFGRQTITVITVTEDLDDRDRLGKPALVRTEVDVPGCRFRPLPATEKAQDGTQVVKDRWQATCPPVPAVVGASSRDEIRVDGVNYKVVSNIRPFPAAGGHPFKVTILCETQDG